MKLNGTVQCDGYEPIGKDGVLFMLSGATIAQAAAIEPPYIVYQDDGETVAADFTGMECTGVYLFGDSGSVQLRAARQLETQAAEAIHAVEQNVAVLSGTVSTVSAKADTAQASAEQAQTAAETAQAAANPQVVTFASIALPSMAASITDEQAITISTLWPEWSADGVQYKVDDVVNHGGHLYRCEQAHTSQADWTPDAAPSLWSRIDIAGDGVDVWTQPTGAHNAYNTGDRVHYPTADDPIYVSTIDGNTWSPDAYPAGWQLEQAE